MRSGDGTRAWIGSVLACPLVLVLAACEREAERPSTPPSSALRSAEQARPSTPTPSARDARVLALVELPRQETTSTLSGAYFDAPRRTLHLVQDRHAQLVPLTASADFRSFTVGTPLPLQGRPDPTWDGEAVARAGDELFVVAIETAARVERFDRSGRYLGTLAVPARFAQHAGANKGLESLSAAPSGRWLFTANEAALATDGPRASKSTGTLVRVTRLPLAGGPAEERAYRTEPLGAGGAGSMGVSDLAALSDDELLVLEKGFQPGYGNTVRIFRVDLRGAVDVGQRDALAADVPVLPKRLVVDVGQLSSEGVQHHSPQPNPLLENYEALALGPELPDGTRVVLLACDDNKSDAQRPRVLALALRL